ncbi:hypothetical protein [Corynebacterium belfantii]|uniref:hypothetical protein n=1 Tax=Corynebacterium belfantii TaxID=2014537 RepID=UPI0010C386A5|nr:hypothetical protein [Corynebacterium belfantii]QBZ29935.1 hypothetical protein E4653_08980 [Corynebacterium diphtheriae subsp. lausannense]QVI98580.1 hypothetical protein KFR76_14020 [Corynebacterium diphtheriae]
MPVSEAEMTLVKSCGSMFLQQGYRLLPCRECILRFLWEVHFANAGVKNKGTCNASKEHACNLVVSHDGNLSRFLRS